jgi:sodium-coupled neutral amino acid transporter 11
MAVQYDQRDLSIRTSLVSGAGERQTLLTPTRHRRSRGASFRQLEEDLGPMTWEAFTAMVGSAANLMATSMGTGMLALPIAVYYSGAVTGTVLIIAMAILSDISLVFLVNAAQQSGTTDLQGLGRYYYGPNGEMMVNTSLVALLLCAALSILIAIADLLTPIWQQSLQTDNYDQWYCQKWFVMCLCCALIYPISIPSNLAPLKWSSFGAVMSIFLVFVFMCIRFVQHGVAKDSPIELFVDSPLAALALPIQGLAYASQFNVVGLYIELGPHKKRMKSVIHYSCAFTCVIYACFGLLGYLYFGAETGKYSMILDGFHNDTLMLVAGAMISLTNILKMPLIILPFRNTVNQILFGKTDISLLMSAFETVFLLILVYFLAVQVGDLALALELSGPTVGVFVCFILPGILAYKSDKEKLSKLLPPYAYDEESFSRTQISALVVAMVGALMGLASCVGLAFQESDDHHHHHHSHNATIT